MNYKTKCITQNMFVSFSKCNSKTSAFLQHLILKKNADKHLKNADKHLKNVQKKQNMKWLTRQKKIHCNNAFYT